MIGSERRCSDSEIYWRYSQEVVRSLPAPVWCHQTKHHLNIYEHCWEQNFLFTSEKPKWSTLKYLIIKWSIIFSWLVYFVILKCVNAASWSVRLVKGGKETMDEVTAPTWVMSQISSVVHQLNTLVFVNVVIFLLIINDFLPNRNMESSSLLRSPPMERQDRSRMMMSVLILTPDWLRSRFTVAERACWVRIYIRVYH